MVLIVVLCGPLSSTVVVVVIILVVYSDGHDTLDATEGHHGDMGSSGGSWVLTPGSRPLGCHHPRYAIQAILRVMGSPYIP